MAKFLVYEIWTRSRIIEAITLEQAYEIGQPIASDDELDFSNWHVVPITEGPARTPKVHSIDELIDALQRDPDIGSDIPGGGAAN